MRKLSRTVNHCKYFLNQLQKKSLVVDDSSPPAWPGPETKSVLPLAVDARTDAAIGKRVLLMMAKYWHPGLVKTRLAAAIGELAAAELHHVFVRQLAASLSSCGDRRQILASPDDCCDAFAPEVAPAWSVFPQGDGDLGQRMWRAFRLAMSAAEPCWMTVMIGTDLPTLTAAEIDRAFAALGSNDVVLGPARDGGYYLIGVRGSMGQAGTAAGHPVEKLFQDVAWSTSAVLAQTQHLAAEAGLKVALLEQREDIDTQVELGRLIRQLRESDLAAELVLGEQINRVLRRHRLASLFSAETSTN